MDERTFSTAVCLIGGGGHALVVAEAARLQGLDVVGFFDDRTTSSLMHYVSRWLGTCDQADTGEPGARRIIAIGDLKVRHEFLSVLRIPFGTVVHPSAVISSKSDVGLGSFVAAGAVINCNARVGEHAIVNTRAVVEHECSIDTNVHIGPACVLGGGVRVGGNTLIGLNASVKPNVVIGRNCIVGAGAVVVDDVHDDSVVVGMPARPIARSELHRRRSA